MFTDNDYCLELWYYNHLYYQDWACIKYHIVYFCSQKDNSDIYRLLDKR